MRVLVISNMYPSTTAPTFGIFVKNQVEALGKRGLHLDVAAVTNPNMGKRNVMEKYSKWMFHTCRRFLSKESSYDIIHAHYAFPSGMLARWFKKRYGIPYVVTSHGGDLNKMARKSPFFFKQTKKILQDAAHVIVVGYDLEQQVLHDFEVPPEKLSVFSMGVNRDVFYPHDTQLVREKLGVNSEHKHLLYVGNILPEKGSTDLIEGFAKVKEDMPETKLHIVGQPKQQSYYDKLTKRIETLGLTEDVHFHGSRPQAEVAEWMSAADVFVLPSHIEGFGLVAVEAMACATPVVGTDTGGLSHLLAEDAGALAMPKQPETLAASVMRVLKDDVYRKRLLENAKKRVEENDAEEITDRVLSIYEKAIQKGTKQ
ncbi:glycosyltransferase family 4 protein [Alteribacillus sp. HJP-4]|uniref:glycosyltransferase family 4 protein n=1 Tax=Alteribacillus sp. HJP-4 TaxID=2775394 RepID=UPI0035CCD45A